MPANDIIKYFNLVVDGRGYAGDIEEFNAPDLTLATEEFRAGGMDAPIDIDMGLEKLTTSFVLTNYSRDVLSLWGVKLGEPVQLTLRGSMESEDGGQPKPILINMQAKLTAMTRGTWGGGAKPSLSCSGTLSYYREEIDGVVSHEIDVKNMVRIVGGVDQLEAHRRHLGI